MLRDGNTAILVGVDGSDDGLRAVDYAVAEAAVHDADLEIVTVIDARGPFGSVLPHSATLRQAAHHAAEAGRRRAAASGLPAERVRAAVVEGHPGAALAQLSNGARAMVLGRRGLSGLERIFAGSTSVAVAARAHCPVIVVPHRWQAPRTPRLRIGVGIDGSERSLPALAAAFAECAARGAELVVVFAWEPPMESYPGVADYQVALDVWADTADLRMSETLIGWQAEYPEVVVHRRFVRSNPVAALVEASNTLDLLYIGVRGRGSISGVAPGTVARALVAATFCPLALIRRETATPIARTTTEDKHAGAARTEFSGS